MVHWSNFRRSTMIAGSASALVQRLTGTGTRCMVPDSISASSASASAAVLRRTELLSCWRNLSTGVSRNIPGVRQSSFFGEGFSVPSVRVSPGLPGSLLRSLGGVRMMGGGPRTFPGGVTKWQWKRMQDKKARQIEKARLLRERQAFEERRRQELLAASPRLERPWEASRPSKTRLPPPSAAQDPQLQALADRFRRIDGEDLWTEVDGPENAAGLPSLVSARFLPDHSKRIVKNDFHGQNGDGEESRGRGSLRTAVAVPGPRLKGNRVRSGRGENGSNLSGGSSLSQSNVNSVSASRQLSTSSRQEAHYAQEMETFTKERVNPVVGHRQGEGSTRMQPSQGGLQRSGSVKRVANSSAEAADHLAEDVKQLRKKVKQTTLVEEGGDVGAKSHLSESRFDDFDVSPLSLKALHDVMGYERMTEVQEKTFGLILEGKDVLAKAKTGTGKTIAFLLPAIESILNLNIDRSSLPAGRSPVVALVICPTRELASQAATESKTLMTYHKGLDAQIVIGGTNINSETNNLQKRPCQVVVATPGRLLDHMNSRDFRQQLSQLKVLVLDEADRLLDMGFRKDLEKIIKMLPEKRQTLLFSATVPDEVHKVSKLALKKGHVFVDTVGQDVDDTHAKVRQNFAIVPAENQLGVIYSVLRAHMSEDKDFKVLVFSTTARCTQLLAEWGTKLGLKVLEIHSRKSQTYRTRVSDEFRNSPGGVIMFTSDVSARGVDYPNVTLVIQLGIPAGREEYIHRLGRTGRAGKDGQGVLILAPWEQSFLKALKDIPITEYPNLKTAPEIVEKVNTAIDKVNTDTKEKAYQAWLGYYNSAKMLDLNKIELVRLANHFSYTLGMDEPPALSKKTIGMMGLRGVPGLRSQ